MRTETLKNEKEHCSRIIHLVWIYNLFAFNVFHSWDQRFLRLHVWM